ncbi:DUF1302 family protein [Neptuniibacter halophilus]|uniref:DUF1302 family protein n=1 Tax=Neptuniibacter halophilus TaxID=651666 RepID=UPI0025729AB5|nr:DUF1302 family protein [Neptuniibacter halophilus]
MRLCYRSVPLLLALSAPSLHAQDDWGEDVWAEPGQQEIRLHGFVELAAGGRIDNDPVLADDDLSLAEFRSRLELETYADTVRLSAKLDLYADGVEPGAHLDIRESLADISLADNADLRLGHQVLTWGTGDLLFLNDLFAKDWQSFFSGRDDEYLKAPSTSLKLSLYGQKASLDLVWTPELTPDRFINGERFSYFSAGAGQQVAAPENKIDPTEPKQRLANGELAARLYGRRDLGSGSATEWALYAYRGYWKQPNAINADGEPYFSRLNSLGASLRGNLARGIAHAELAWYQGQDHQGNDPRLPNDQLRLLLGYEQELAPRLTLGLQYYLERTLDYDALSENDSGSVYRVDEHRQLWTMRLSYRAMQDRLSLSWFSFYSDTDQDAYHRPSLSYKFNDNLNLTLGANLFSGAQPHSFFGQFDQADNVYARLRFSY